MLEADLQLAGINTIVRNLPHCWRRLDGFQTAVKADLYAFKISTGPQVYV